MYRYRRSFPAFIAFGNKVIVEIHDDFLHLRPKGQKALGEVVSIEVEAQVPRGS